MPSQNGRALSGRQYPCENCPLRPLPVFREFEKEELAFISKFKKGELAVDKGATVLVEGSHSAHLYTVLSGWAFRYKLLPDGRRQILNYLMPGDLIGLQGSVMGEMQHSVEALSPMLLCVFERDNLHELYRSHPGLGYDITWIASREERMLDENLLSVGRRSSIERAAYLIAFIASRAKVVGLNGKQSIKITNRNNISPTRLGCRWFRTNKTIRKLMDRKLILWRDGGCEVVDTEGSSRSPAGKGLGEAAGR